MIYTVDILDYSQFAAKQCSTRAFTSEIAAHKYGEARQKAFRDAAPEDYRESIRFEVHAVALNDAAF